MPRATGLSVQVEGVGLARRQQQGESTSAALDVRWPILLSVFQTCVRWQLAAVSLQQRWEAGQEALELGSVVYSCRIIVCRDAGHLHADERTIRRVASVKMLC